MQYSHFSFWLTLLCIIGSRFAHLIKLTQMHSFLWLTNIPLWASQVVLVVKNLPANAGDTRDACSIPRLGRFPGEGHGNPHQYSCLDNPMDRGAWQATVYRVAQSQTRLKWLSIGQYSIVYMYHSFFIHSSVDAHLGCFHVLAIVSSAEMNNGIHVSFSVLVSSRYMPTMWCFY